MCSVTRKNPTMARNANRTSPDRDQIHGRGARGDPLIMASCSSASMTLPSAVLDGRFHPHPTFLVERRGLPTARGLPDPAPGIPTTESVRHEQPDDRNGTCEERGEEERRPPGHTKEDQHHGRQ